MYHLIEFVLWHYHWLLCAYWITGWYSAFVTLNINYDVLIFKLTDFIVLKKHVNCLFDILIWNYSTQNVKTAKTITKSTKSNHCNIHHSLTSARLSPSILVSCLAYKITGELDLLLHRFMTCGTKSTISLWILILYCKPMSVLLNDTIITSSWTKVCTIHKQTA